MLAIVPDEGQDILGQYFTAALDIRDCSHLCLDSIYIIVNAPCIAVGAHFSYNADHTPMFELSHSTVTVRSPRGQPYGLLGTEAGALSVVHCNIDVANPDDVEGHMPNGMSIWGGADIYVNSSVVMVDKGQRWFVPRENATGLITVTHTDLWSPNGQAVSQPVPPDDNPGSDSLDSGFGRGDLSWNKNAVVEAGPVFYLDPQFQQQGAWGAWDKPADVRAYYSLQSSSPCIDQADIQYGIDPDGTLPDIGQFYFPQSQVDTTSSEADERDALPLVMEILPPFPNPFNATTVVPFLLNRSGQVEMNVYDLLGRKVSTLASGHLSTGSHEARFTANNLPSGLYVVSLEFNGVRVTNRPVLLIK